jgi:hypothetical protein
MRILPGSLEDSDAAAVVSFTGTNSGMSHDRGRLQEAAMKLQSKNLYQHAGRECPDIDYYRADLIQNRHEEVAFEAAVQDALTCANLDPRTFRGMAEGMTRSAASRALTAGDRDVHLTLGFVKEVIQKMSALPGQRMLILVSPGFLTVTPEAMSAKSEVIDLDSSERGGGFHLRFGNRNWISITSWIFFSCGRRHGTGGTYFHNSNDLTGGLKNLTAEPEYIYLLEFSLENGKQDGTYHRLKVIVDQQGLKLQARRGYFAAGAADKGN